MEVKSHDSIANRRAKLPKFLSSSLARSMAINVESGRWFHRSRRDDTVPWAKKKKKKKRQRIIATVVKPGLSERTSLVLATNLVRSGTADDFCAWRSRLRIDSLSWPITRNPERAPLSSLACTRRRHETVLLLDIHWHDFADYATSNIAVPRFRGTS